MSCPEELLEHAEVLKLEDGDVVVVRGAKVSPQTEQYIRDWIGKDFVVVSIPKDASIGVLRTEATKALRNDAGPPEET